MGRYKVDPEGGTPYFCTCTIMGWLAVFNAPPYFQIIIDSLNYCRQHKGILLNGYVIMPNHLHLILLPLQGIDLSGVMRDFKRYTSRAITKQLQADKHVSFLRFFERAAAAAGGKSDYKVWREEFHPEELHTRKWFEQKLRYIHENPVRKGFVDEAAHWRYSSARNYEHGDHSVIEVDFLDW
jgi:REP element-mobilizing transposase RayT